MNLYTSYWAQVRNFPKSLIGLNTTMWPPKWRPLGQDKNGVWVLDCPPLKPGAECEGLCHGDCHPQTSPHCPFIQIYYNQLMKMDFTQFINTLMRLRDRIKEGENLESVDFAFIVYETPQNQCSERWALQKWVRTNGFEIEEWHK